LVALFRQEKLPFFIPGFPLQSGLKSYPQTFPKERGTVREYSYG
jgi:hypothetical protein